jgi:hypothetical protein
METGGGGGGGGGQTKKRTTVTDRDHTSGPSTRPDAARIRQLNFE